MDPGEATNRTVVTFVGSPEAVIEAAFAGVKRAAELIDMRRHKGAHPRMGATDVLPLIPICGITLAEVRRAGRKLAERIAAELHVPTYCYEAAAFTPSGATLRSAVPGVRGVARNWRTRRRPRFPGRGRSTMG